MHFQRLPNGNRRTPVAMAGDDDGIGLVVTEEDQPDYGQRLPVSEPSEDPRPKEEN
jgi:hypothetical protein